MKPRLLANENFPAPSVAALRQAGFDVLDIGEDSAGMVDPGVLARARSEGRWLLTFDTDYGELLFARRLPPPPALFLLREPHYRPAEPAQWLLPLLANAADYEGMFCVITRDSVRKRPLLRAVDDGPA